MQDLLQFVQAFISYFIFALLMQVLRLKALWLKAIFKFFSRISTTAFGYTHECVLCKRLQCTVLQVSPKTYICTKVSKGEDVPRQSGTGCPIVPLSRDKTVSLPRCPGTKKSFLAPLSLCPGTRAAAKIPGQTLLSRDVPGQNHYLIGNF